LILCPFARRTTRHIAIVLSLGLHVSFSLLLNLEIFTPAMLAFLPNLLPGEDFDALERRWRRGRQREVILDGSAGVLFQAARVLARLDPGGRLTLRPAAVPDPGRADSTAPEPADQAVLVITPAGDRRWAGVAALAEIARTLPAGRPLAWLLRLPGVHHLAEACYRRFARRRFAISAALGMPGCLPSGSRPESPVRRPEPPALAVGRAWLARLRELMVALFILVALSELIVDNQALRAVAPLNRPSWIGQLTSYLQVPQGWSMFAPDVSRTDMNLSVDAITQDGRHVDPFAEVANPRYPFPGMSIPAALYQNSFLIDYALRLPSIPDYHQAFKEWVLRYPERTRNDRDTIVSFRAYVVEDDSPPPGERQPRNARSRVFLEFTK
jgi:predicted DCC family thiol-disulfide oxidoreductase YuxK